MNRSGAFAHFTETVRVENPKLALVLGSGMGAVVDRLDKRHGIPFHEVPGLATPTVPGHKGLLTLGRWAGRAILVFEGRYHYYEGHCWRDVTLPVRTAGFLGVRSIVFTNAVGGIHEALVPGSLMVVRDHIEWTRPHPRSGSGPGGASPESASPYSPEARRRLHDAANDLGMKLFDGIYAAVTGPNYETPAEIRALRAWGADAVGMSTTREVQAAREEGLMCAALSCVTNRAAGLSQRPISHQEVLDTAAQQVERLADLLERFLSIC
jgi:purine-nucleoside phosphorylase